MIWYLKFASDVIEFLQNENDFYYIKLYKLFVFLQKKHICMALENKKMSIWSSWNQVLEKSITRIQVI